MYVYIGRVGLAAMVAFADRERYQSQTDPRVTFFRRKPVLGCVIEMPRPFGSSLEFINGSDSPKTDTGRLRPTEFAHTRVQRVRVEPSGSLAKSTGELVVSLQEVQDPT